MKSHPMIFGADSVMAILAGKKTQTRRVVKGIPQDPGEGAYFDAYNGGPFWNWWTTDNKYYLPQIQIPIQVGDTIWVREGYRRLKCHCEAMVHYDQWSEWWEFVEPGEAPELDVEMPPIWFLADGDEPETGSEYMYGSPVSPLFLRRAWSRLTLRVTNVRVERLQEITEDDAIAEGIPEDILPQALTWFLGHWDAINGKRGFPWESNPWVVAYTFERVLGSDTKQQEDTNGR